MNQYYIPFSQLAINTVFKILDKEETENKYGETLVIYLEQNPHDNKYGEDVIIKTNAPKCLKEKMIEDKEKNEYIISKGTVKGKKSLKVMYLNSDSINYQRDSPQEADFENIEDDLTQAQKIDVALKIGSSYTIRDVFYFKTKYGESGIAKLKYEETMETVRIYLPKSIKQDIKLARKINKKKIMHEKLKYEGFGFKGEVKIQKYKYTFEELSQ